MQLEKWTTVNRRYFAPRSGPTQKQWQSLIREGAVRGLILGPLTFVDIDQLASCVELTATPDNDIPDLLK